MQASASASVEISTEAVDINTDSALLWDDDPRVRIGGEWFPGELRTAISHYGGRVALLGYCFASEDVIQTTVDKALRSGDLSQLTTMPGQYSAIVMHSDGMTALADYAGVAPVYHADVGGQQIVSTSSERLAQQTNATIDQLTLLASIVCPFVPGVTSGRSHWEGVGLLEGGQRLTATTSGRYSIDTYQPLVPNPDATYEDAVALLRDNYDEALLCRVLSGLRITSDLSGGYDSSSGVFMALRHMASSDVLDTVIMYNDTPGMSAGDLKHARGLAALDPRICLHELDTSNLLPYTGVAQLPRRDEPDPGLLKPGIRDTKRFGYLHELGSELHLTGLGGDNQFNVSPDYLRDLVNLRGVSQLYRDGVAYARLYSVPPWSLWARALRNAKSDLASALENLAQRLERFGTADAPKPTWLPGQESAFGWLTEDARLRLAALVREKARDASLPEHMTAGDYVARHMTQTEARSVHRQRERARDFGIRLDAPIFDHKVLLACRLASAEKRASPRRFKGLIRDALVGMVPPQVHDRQTKGAYDAELYSGMRQEESGIRLVASLSRLALANLVNTPVIITAWERRATRRLSLPSFNAWLANESYVHGLPEHLLPKVIPQESTALHSMLASGAEVYTATHYVVQEYVYAASADDGSLVFLHDARGTYTSTTPTAGVLLQVLNACKGNVTRAIAHAQRMYPAIGEEVLKRDMQQCIAFGLEHDLLRASTTPHTIDMAHKPATSRSYQIEDDVVVAWGGKEKEGLTLGQGLLCTGALSASIILRHLRRERSARVLDWLNAHWAKNIASEGTILDTQSQMYQVARWYPGKAACLEIPLATSLALTVLRHEVHWAVGTAFYPARPHAYNVANGRPIGSQLNYQPFFGTKSSVGR